MEWNRVGSLTRRIDEQVDRREDFTYDGLGRLQTITLKTAGGGVLGTESVAYGPSGNISSKGSYTSYQYQPARPHAERDANNHAEYWYGPGGDRAVFRQSARINGQIELTLYGGALYERRIVGAAATHLHYIQANGATVATVHRQGTDVTNTTRYLHKDHFGSVVAITSQACLEQSIALGTASFSTRRWAVMLRLWRRCLCWVQPQTAETCKA